MFEGRRRRPSHVVRRGVSLDTEPVVIGVARLAYRPAADGEEPDLGAYPLALPRREGLAHGREARPVRAVAEAADRALRDAHAQVEGAALVRRLRALRALRAALGVLHDRLRDDEPGGPLLQRDESVVEPHHDEAGLLFVAARGEGDFGGGGELLGGELL